MSQARLESNHAVACQAFICSADLTSYKLSRKNSLFAGSDEGGAAWARMASLIETCKLNLVNPQRYLADVLTRLVGGWPQSRINELMPWHWTTEQAR